MVILFHPHVAQGVSRAEWAEWEAGSWGCGSRVRREDSFRNRSRRYPCGYDGELRGKKREAKARIPRDLHSGGGRQQ